MCLFLNISAQWQQNNKEKNYNDTKSNTNYTVCNFLFKYFNTFNAIQCVRKCIT